MSEGGAKGRPQLVPVVVQRAQFVQHFSGGGGSARRSKKKSNKAKLSRKGSTISHSDLSTAESMEDELRQLRRDLLLLESRVTEEQEELRELQGTAETRLRACEQQAEDFSLGPGDEVQEKVIAEGWLQKKGRKVRNWKRRWFVLQGSHLRYYKGAAEAARPSEKLGEINLETCVVEELKEREESGRPCMALLVEGRKFLFYGESEAENYRWYLFLVCKNAELTYLRKLKIQSLQPDPDMVEFFRTPLVDRVCVRDSALHLDAVVALSQVVPVHAQIASLVVHGAAIGDLGCTTLADAVRRAPSLRSVDLSQNDISGDSAVALAKMIEGCSSLVELNLSDNAIADDGVIALARALPSSALRSLQLDRNQIGSPGATALCMAIAKSPKLAHIHLRDNAIGDVGAEAVAMAIEDGALQSVDARGCGMGAKGVQRIASALLHSKTVSTMLLDGNQGVEDEECKRLFMRLALGNKALEKVTLGPIALLQQDLGLLRLLYDCHYLPEEMYASTDPASSS